MRLSTCVSARRGAVPSRAAKPLWALLAVLLAGCAGQSEYDEYSWYGGDRLAMEADGLPAQIPPLRRTKTERDDPTEPFSPNYGPPPPTEPKTPPIPTVPADLQPESRRQIASASSI